MIKFTILFFIGVIARQAYGDAPEPIVGGNFATSGQFKHQVSLQAWEIHICGGTIINENYILTAAHCVDDPDLTEFMAVVSGTTSSTGGGTVHNIKWIRVHPEYSNKKEDGWRNDIAVIALTAPIRFDSLRAPLPLATKDYATGTYRGIISGWGKTSVSSDSSPLLKWVEVNVLSTERCLHGHKNPHTNPKQVCTLERVGKGACQGDSGGPLMVNGELCGVVSWVLPCALGVSDVFTNVYHYLDFIKESMEMH